MTEISGPRLLLRDFTESDEEAVHAFAGDPRVTTYTEWGPNTVEATRRFLTDVVAQRLDEDRIEYNLAAVLPGTGHLIGSVAIWVPSPAHRRGELGFVFHPDFWGRGYASEATSLLLDFGFLRLGLGRIAATCHPDNHASARVLEKCGLVLEGRMRDHMLVRGAWRDSLLFAAVARDHAGRSGRDGGAPCSPGGDISS